MNEGDFLLAKRAANGDESAFEEIVRRNQDLVYNLCVSSLRSHHDALDVSQDTFLKAYKALGKYRGDSKLSSWIFSICKNCILDFKRRNARNDVPLERDEDGEGGIEIEEPCADAYPEQTAEKNERIAAVRQAIASLPDEWKELIILREYGDKSYAEISEITGIEIGTVKSRINRARNKIKDYLKERNFLT